MKESGVIFSVIKLAKEIKEREFEFFGNKLKELNNLSSSLFHLNDNEKKIALAINAILFEKAWGFTTIGEIEKSIKKETKNLGVVKIDLNFRVHQEFDYVGGIEFDFETVLGRIYYKMKDNPKKIKALSFSIKIDGDLKFHTESL